METLAELLGQRLASGVIPASEVMALALYHPVHGYYRRAEGPWGFEGKDYYTALDCGPLLGQSLALRLEAAWESLGRPTTFTVLEPGAGRGWLGRDLLAARFGEEARSWSAADFRRHQLDAWATWAQSLDAARFARNDPPFPSAKPLIESLGPRKTGGRS